MERSKRLEILLNDIGTAMRPAGKRIFSWALLSIAQEDGVSLEVVDGQQRLATTVILLAAIRDHFSRNK